MNRFEIETRLNELKDCKRITIIRGQNIQVFSCSDIVNYPNEEYFLYKTFNEKIHYSDITELLPSPLD